jgi:hypothetical protein
VVDRPVIVAAAGRPCVGEMVSGDRWTVEWSGAACRIAVIDGLGHGPLAAEAAAAAVQALKEQPELGPAEALRRCHTALRGTRGAAISVARIDPVAGSLSYAGVGNVEARLWRNGHQERPIAYRGIVGNALPTIRVFEFLLGPAWAAHRWRERTLRPTRARRAAPSGPAGYGTVATGRLGQAE